MDISALTSLKMVKRHNRGFTLIELLVVIGILAVLLAIVLVAINPARQFEQANNTKRKSDVNAILNAVHQYMADNNGNLPGGSVITDEPAEIASGTGNADLCALLVTDYLAAIPTDPSLNTDPVDEDGCANYATGYQISSSATNNRITVISTLGAEEISVTR